MFDGVLHLFDVRRDDVELLQAGHHQRFGDLLGLLAVKLIGGLAGTLERVGDFLCVEILDGSVPFDDVPDLHCHFDRPLCVPEGRLSNV